MVAFFKGFRNVKCQTGKHKMINNDELFQERHVIYAKFIKRLLDIIVSLTFIILFFWLYLILALLVRIKLGSPILFKQKRPGRDEKIFNMYKFRTMTDERDSDGNLLPDSDRLTTFGRFLRKTSLDELPQLINVFLGDMSLVGPRPPVVYHPYNTYDGYPDWAKKRFDVRPGITGLAQIKTRTTVPWDDRIKIDNKYVDSYGLFFDIKVMFLTFISVLSKKKIYPETKEQINNKK